MLKVEIDKARGVALLEPDGPLSREDFESAVKIIDPVIEERKYLNGLIIHTDFFPGWDSFAALLTHLKFVQEHHKKISRIAFATDSVIKGLAEAVGSHFVNAEIKGFSYRELEQARAWVAGTMENSAHPIT